MTELLKLINTGVPYPFNSSVISFVANPKSHIFISSFKIKIFCYLRSR